MIINICKIFAITPISREGAIDLVFRTQLFWWEMHSLLEANLFEQLQRCKTFSHHWLNVGKASIKINSFRSWQSSSHLPKCPAAIRAKCENNWVLWRSNHLTPACLCQHTNASQWPLIANNEGGNWQWRWFLYEMKMLRLEEEKRYISSYLHIGSICISGQLLCWEGSFCKPFTL